MSSFDIRAIREITNDPLSKFANDLAKKFNKFIKESELQKLDDKEDIYSDGQDIDTALKFNEFNSQKSFDLTTEYFPTTEPDYDKMRMWIKASNMGNRVHEKSGFENVVNIFGDVLLVDGAPFDYGIHTQGVKSMALRFNRPNSATENQDYLEIPDVTNIRMAVPTGISYFFRFKIYDLDPQEDYDRTLFNKEDDANNAVMIQVTSTGRIQFLTKNSGTERNKQTGQNTIAVDTVYDVWCTYEYSGNVFHIYINGVDQTITDRGSVSWPNETDAQIFRRSDTTGYVYGDLYDFIYMSAKIVSTAEVGYHYTNKWTLANIPYGQVLVTDYFGAST